MTSQEYHYDVIGFPHKCSIHPNSVCWKFLQYKNCFYVSNISGELNLSALMDYYEVSGRNRIRKEMCELRYSLHNRMGRWVLPEFRFAMFISSDEIRRTITNIWTTFLNTQWCLTITYCPLSFLKVLEDKYYWHAWHIFILPQAIKKQTKNNNTTCVKYN